MSSEIRVPTLGESVTEATIAQWYKKPGDAVAIDEPLCELETDKVTIEVPAQSAGVLAEVTVAEGETVEVGALLGSIGEGTGKENTTENTAPPPETAPAASAEPTPAPPPVAAPPAAATPAAAAPEPAPAPIGDASALSPAVRRVVEEHGLDPAQITGTGKDGRLTKQDAMAAASAPVTTAAPVNQSVNQSVNQPGTQMGVREERVKMTRLRKTIAARLKESQNTAAQLSTFNEVDMGALMQLRRDYKDLFEQKYGARLGFMSFFARACVTALREIPAVNAEIADDEIIYKNFINMGVAVGTEKGLVVPVIRDVQDMGLADIELAVAGMGRKARDGKLSLEDLQGGTFTMSNGGVYGSLMSTPILNMPQSGILGMHKIQDRPVVVNGEVAVRPMMYLALSYDHRIVDGKEAVTFLVRVKECLENPERMLLDI
ncbi:2-oxoglutarate dehydrogenase complex dihydrolipoyllysine-residue succinyltransferase [Alphaproteobacteria bacterium]|nr:2-oxoglutarate dehydrogenase complex dihydrolipoyllysine-residue succinyltransferase [Alphaproteobacteria bacterium]MDA8780467.1 2-oxoglutarate dehydrogenase complex dihydrolipoyllysine-residue succinyltransferase [Alphaproteobacteria bacterium]MDB2393516.1 2-oxoglutarate dehydrogenase complex dihydrolipoyllysine-residue succinyltransferase [Alphaproteobacteria bacterium]MDB2477555.1 2-oxoglutarate dehydrogenase complex dihydrolipoyllysine-residue succinyltransferase [Alphaproteobacteria bact